MKILDHQNQPQMEVNNNKEKKQKSKFEMQFSVIKSQLNLLSLHADSLVWTSKTLQQDYSSQRINDSIIYKKGLKPIYLQQKFNKFHDQTLSFLKPDYGSLGEFITDINLNTDLLKQKKKKIDGQDQNQQKKIKHQLQNKNLNKILLNPQLSLQQRSVACKILIERSFEQCFGASILQLNQQQLQRNKEDKNSLINISSLDEALQKILNKSSSLQNQNDQKDKTQINTNIHYRSIRNTSSLLINEKQLSSKRLLNNKNNYRSLLKLNIPQKSTNQFNQLKLKFLTQNKQTIINQNSIYKTNNNLSNKQFITIDHKFFQVSDHTIILKNLLEISNQTILYIISQIHFNTLNEISIVNTVWPNPDLFLLLLDLLAAEAKNLKIFTLQSISLLNQKLKGKISQKIKMIIETACDSLEQLKINKMNLSTKDFCILCLGIGSTKQLQKVELKDNKIDENGKKSYDVIGKFFKQLELDLSGNPLGIQVFKTKQKSQRLLKKSIKKIDNQ